MIAYRVDIGKGFQHGSNIARGESVRQHCHLLPGIHLPGCGSSCTWPHPAGAATGQFMASAFPTLLNDAQGRMQISEKIPASFSPAPAWATKPYAG